MDNKFFICIRNLNLANENNLMEENIGDMGERNNCLGNILDIRDILKMVIDFYVYIFFFSISFVLYFYM